MVSVCVFAANESWAQMDDSGKTVWQRKAIAAIRKHELAMRKPNIKEHRNSQPPESVCVLQPPAEHYS